MDAGAKPDVINNSWGGDNDDDDWFSEITEAWIEEGIVPVFAAGNQSSGDPAPGSIANPGKSSGGTFCRCCGQK